MVDEHGPSGPLGTGSPPTGSTQPTLVGGAIGMLGTGTVVASRYRLTGLLGAGGMAQVWEGVDDTLGRRVAVKVLHPHLADDDVFVRRFRQEAIAAARLSHPGIVGIYDTCSDGTHEAIVMELLEARTLREVLDERGSLDVESVQRIGLRLLDALEAAHAAGLVHRDIKPSNILLCTDGRVKVADFGIAKADDATELTSQGTLLGTATYLAPEQLTDSPVDGRADLYSLGIVLYESLTGVAPFEGDSGAAVALARLHVDPVDPRRLRADIPNGLAEAILRALRRERDERFADAAAFRAALSWAAGETAHHRVVEPMAEPMVDPMANEAPPAAPVEGFGRSERRWLLPALSIVLVGTALVVAGLLLRRTAEPVVEGPATSLPAEATAATIASVGTFDPQGSGTPGENDDLAALAVDGDSATAWRTERYDAPDFGNKDGVGLVVTLERAAELEGVTIETSANGWSGELFVVEGGGLPDPGSEPVSRFDEVRGPLEVDLGGRRGDTILLWITNLGDPLGAGHRVEVAEVRVAGVVAG